MTAIDSSKLSTDLKTAPRYGGHDIDENFTQGYRKVCSLKYTLLIKGTLHEILSGTCVI